VALGAEVVDLVGLELVEELGQRRRVGQVPVVGEKADARLVRVVVEVIDPVGVEARGTADDAVDLVALLQQELGQVGAVLAGDAGDQRTLRLRFGGHRPANIGACRGQGERRIP
jgi:hypothetical protein